MPVEPLVDRDRLAALLDEGSPWRLQTLAATGSTNHDLAEQARTGAVAGQVLIADQQTAGRGRFDRTWISPAGTSVSTSILLRPSQPAEQWGWLSILVGLSVKYAISLMGAGSRCTLKWPNDVLVEGKKICGILSERVNTPIGAAAICGWGVNLTMTAAELPTERATSLVMAGIEADRERLLALTLNRLAALLRRWDEGDSLAKDYAAECATLGRQVRVELDEENHLGPAVTGLACGIGVFGELQVLADGQVHEFMAGDVIHLR